MSNSAKEFSILSDNTADRIVLFLTIEENRPNVPVNQVFKDFIK